jgi:hypothetical protein
LSVVTSRLKITFREQSVELEEGNGAMDIYHVILRNEGTQKGAKMSEIPPT